MSCKEGKDSLLLKFNKGTLFSIYHLELKKELLRTPNTMSCIKSSFIGYDI